jgi:DNA-binding CsgD family transcriptional regulator
MVLAKPEGKIQFADPAARRWLKLFFGRPTRPGLLPRKVCRWLAKHINSRDATSLLGEKSDALLYLKRQHSYTDDSMVLLLELIKGKREEGARRHHLLTGREREVLFWVTRGKSNGEIGAILGIARATVGKHLERIYPKLGVENRTAAATSFETEK